MGLLIAINSLFVYFLFFSIENPKIIVVNQSKTYKLDYQSSKYYSEFLDNFVHTKNTKPWNFNSLKVIQITLNDITITNPSHQRIYPLKVEANNSINSGKFTININIDPSLASDFTQDEINSITTSLIMIKLYNYAHPILDLKARTAVLNGYSRTFYRLNNYPFTLNQK